MLIRTPLLDTYVKGCSYFFVAFLLLAGVGCVPQNSPPVPTQQTQLVPGVNSSVDVLNVTTRVDCGCNGENIVPVLYIQPQNGTPPYILPNYNFVMYQLIPANLGDILHITIWSSDPSPLKWTGDILMSCAVVPTCGTSSSISSSSSDSTVSNSSSSTSSVMPSSSSSRSSEESSSRSSGSSSSNSSSSASSSSSSSQSTSTSSSSSSSSGSSSSSSSSSSSGSSNSSSSSSSSSSSVTPIPTCPPKPQGGSEPPGLCKKN